MRTYHEENGTFLSEKYGQPIFLDGPGYRHDIISVIVDGGIRPAEDRESLLAIFDVVESVIEGLMSLR